MLKKWPHWLILLTLFGVLALAFTRGGRSEALRGPGLTVLSPLFSATDGVTDIFGNFATFIGNVGRLDEENRGLRTQVAELERQIDQLREAGQENQSLRGLLGYQRENPGRQYLASRVIAHDPSSMVNAVIIDRGTEQGVQKGMAVVAERGIVGQVQEAYGKVAKVLLTTDVSSTVTGIVQRSRVQGVVTGKADGTLSMQFVSKESDILVGDLIVTSGLGGGFPKGLAIGQVKKVTSNDQDLFKDVILVPTSQVNTLEGVLVILDFLPLPLP